MVASMKIQLKSALLPLLLLVSLVIPTYVSADVLLIGDTPTVMTQENTPTSGMSKQTVRQRYGQPNNKYTHSGRVTKRNPRISVWTYGHYKVYFENRHVIHTLVIASPLDEN